MNALHYYMLAHLCIKPAWKSVHRTNMYTYPRWKACPVRKHCRPNYHNGNPVMDAISQGDPCMTLHDLCMVMHGNHACKDRAVQGQHTNKKFSLLY